MKKKQKKNRKNDKKQKTELKNELNKAKSFNEARNQMTKKATFLAAAYVISQPHFPSNSELPRFYPKPFNNFGHYFLFDYQLFLEIILQTIEKYKNITKPIAESAKKRYKNIWLIVTAIVLIIIFTEHILGILIVLSILFTIPVILSFYYLFTYNAPTKKLITDLTRYKIDEVNALLDGTWERDDSIQFPDSMKDNFVLVGDAKIEREEFPVLTFGDDSHPFPGFGYLQFEQVISCRPKKEEHFDFENKKVFDFAISKIEEKINSSPINCVNFGKVVTVSGDSISVDSKWLDEDKVPILYFLNNNYNEKTSYRNYFVVQVLFPGFMNASSFFIRYFKTEDSIAFHISLTTLGPLVFDEKMIHETITTLKETLNKPDKPLPKYSGISYDAFSPLDDLKFLAYLKESDFPTPHYMPPDQYYILNIDPVKEEEFNKDEYIEKYNNIIEKSMKWPGYHGYQFWQINHPTLNWREFYSLTFTNDFHNRLELRTSIESVYDLISKAILDSFEECDFDVTAYKDAKGNYTINAEKIEQIVIGEKIEHYSSKARKSKS